MMSEEPLQPDATLDCIGLYCPQPVIRTAARIKEMESGQILEIRATDPGFQIDLPAWCLSHRQKFLGMRRKDRVYVGYVLKVDDGDNAANDGR
jgi:TusA-related sulfurtransferase